MPNLKHRGIEISLQPPGHCVLPELPPPNVALTPSPKRYHPASVVNSYKLTAPSSTSSTESSPTPTRIAEIYVPIYPGCQIWINYNCRDPRETSPDVKFFYFKLFQHGICVLSWGIGKETKVGTEGKWCGRVSYGIFDGGTDFKGRKVLERRAFLFPKINEREGGGSFEIKVFRAKARKRESVSCEKYEKQSGGGGGVCLINAGPIKKSEAQRIYTYALIDPVDQPYAAFRYHCRTEEQLNAIGLQIPLASARSDDEMSSPHSKRSQSPDSAIQQSPPPPAIPKDNDNVARRLSFPPRLRLASTSSHDDPHLSPVKKGGARDEVDLQQRLIDRMAISSLDDQKFDFEFGGPPAREQFARKPLPPRPDEVAVAKIAQSDLGAATNAAGFLRGRVANRLRRRGDSRDEKTNALGLLDSTKSAVP